MLFDEAYKQSQLKRTEMYEHSYQHSALLDDEFNMFNGNSYVHQGGNINRKR
jgi:hypothetical protein